MGKGMQVHVLALIIRAEGNTTQLPCQVSLTFAANSRTVITTSKYE